jgi:hypothetical protein
VHELWASHLDPRAVAAAECAIDLDASEASCPACGATFATAFFATTASRCPGCGLRFG